MVEVVDVSSDSDPRSFEESFAPPTRQDFQSFVANYRPTPAARSFQDAVELFYHQHMRSIGQAPSPPVPLQVVQPPAFSSDMEEYMSRPDGRERRALRQARDRSSAGDDTGGSTSVSPPEETGDSIASGDPLAFVLSDGTPVDEPRVYLNAREIAEWRAEFRIPGVVKMRPRADGETAGLLPEGCGLVCAILLRHGLRLPLDPWLQYVLAEYNIALGQMGLNMLRILLSMAVIWD